MFWKIQVRISQRLYKNFRPLMPLLQLIGIFPLTVETQSDQLFLKWSPWLIVYSFAVGAGFVVINAYTVFRDLMENEATTLYETDKIAGFIAHFGSALLVISGIFVTPSNYLRFFKLVSSLNQIDDMLNTPHSKKDTLKSWVMLSTLLLYDAFGIFVDFCFYYTFIDDIRDMTTLIILEALIFYTNGVSFSMEYANRHLVHGLSKRIKRINELLSHEYWKIQKITLRTQGYPKYTRWTTQKPNKLGFLDAKISCSAGALKTLRRAFLETIDANAALNDVLAPNILVLLLFIFSLLSLYVYCFILTLSSKRRGLAEILDLIVCLSMFVIGTLLITEPCYSCLLKMEQTKSFVCKLLSLNTDRHYRKQVNDFATVLCLRPLQFSVYGLFNVDRVLFTSLFSTVTTYVVIFLQYQATETNENLQCTNCTRI